MVEMEADMDQELVTLLCHIFRTSRDHQLKCIERGNVEVDKAGSWDLSHCGTGGIQGHKQRDVI